MKLPRDLSGEDLVKLLRQFGYEPTRQTGSHIRLTSNSKVTPHHVTIPNHQELRVGTLSGILKQVAAYLELAPSDFADRLFAQ